VVKKKAAVVDYALFIPGTPQNTGLNTSLDDLNAQLVYLDDSGVAPLLRILWEPGQPQVSATAWFVNTPRAYYQQLWNYFRNYCIGSAEPLPIGGSTGAFTTTSQPVVSTGTDWAGNATRPVHNALWTFTDTGGSNSFGPNFVCAPAGSVDAVGFDYYTSDPDTWATMGSTPSSQWDDALSYYWPNDVGDAIMGFTETGYKKKTGLATDWLPALAQFVNGDDVPYGPAFFMSWTDQGASQGAYNRWSPFDKSDFPEFWNGAPLQNLDPGAWPMAPQNGGAGFLP
jgi:hypothetical protein